MEHNFHQAKYMINPYKDENTLQQTVMFAAPYQQKRSEVLRKGKWTPEEEKYTNKVIEAFNMGLLKLPESEHGVTLRAYLAEKLGCDPMRITKKYTGASCLGKRVYHARKLNIDAQMIERTRLELQKLEDDFRLKMDSLNQKKSNEAKRHSAKGREHVISTPAIDALLLQNNPFHETHNFNPQLQQQLQLQQLAHGHNGMPAPSPVQWQKSLQYQQQLQLQEQYYQQQQHQHQLQQESRNPPGGPYLPPQAGSGAPGMFLSDVSGFTSKPGFGGQHQMYWTAHPGGLSTNVLNNTSSSQAPPAHSRIKTDPNTDSKPMSYHLPHVQTQRHGTEATTGSGTGLGPGSKMSQQGESRPACPQIQIVSGTFMSSGGDEGLPTPRQLNIADLQQQRLKQKQTPLSTGGRIKQEEKCVEGKTDNDSEEEDALKRAHHDPLNSEPSPPTLPLHSRKTRRDDPQWAEDGSQGSPETSKRLKSHDAQLEDDDDDDNFAASSLLGLLSHIRRNGSQEDLMEFVEGVHQQQNQQPYKTHSSTQNPIPEPIRTVNHSPIKTG